MRVPENLLADCSSCFGLCCVALPFQKSSDFALNKPAGEPCRNLQADSRCGIHSSLRQRGFSGCTVYDCFGAGQKVSGTTFAGRDWRAEPSNRQEMFEVFPIMRDLHELLWYLAEVRNLRSTAPIRTDLIRAYSDIEQTTLGSPATVASVDVGAVRAQTNQLLTAASELVRSEVTGKKKNHRGRDLMGASLGGADLRGANLRGAYLIGANLSRADLTLADMIGADLRGADVRGTDLSRTLFLTQFQVNAAIGNADTRLPDALSRPGHWR